MNYTNPAEFPLVARFLRYTQFDTQSNFEQMARAFSLVHWRVKQADDFVNFSVRL